MATKPKKGPRVPKSPAKFDTYINSGDDHLQAIEPLSGNPFWQELGLSSANALDWHNKRQFWSNITTGLYALYGSPDTSTSIIKGKVKTFIKDFQTFANPLLSIIAASPNATEQEEEIFNLVLNVNRKSPSHTHTKIADKCFTNWESGKLGNMKGSSHINKEAKGRTSVPEGADGIQYAYMIMDENPKTIAARTSAVEKANASGTAARLITPTLLPFIPTPLPVPVPQHPDDGTKQEFFSGASHEFIFGADKEGKYLCSWTRWFNSKHPELSGDWSEMQTVLIG
jgi:hypothetical protein